jgi:hypothetical protein
MAQLDAEHAEHAENGAKGGRKRAENAAKPDQKPGEIEDGPKENSDLGKAGLKPIQKPEARDQKDADANASVVVSAKPKPPPDETRIAFDEWNALAGRHGLPIARKLDEARRRAIRLRLADGGLDAWREALAAVEASEHCRGENDRGWRADLDFVCTASKFRRLIEGAYGSTSATGPPSDFARHAPLRDAPTLDEMRARLDAEIGAVQ